MNYTFRLAREQDAPALCAIYRPYVEDTAISFEVEPPTPAEFAARLADIARDYPYLVCLSGGAVVGYAYAHRQMERAAYQWNAELSVYIAPGHHRRGLGRRLYAILIEILRMQNVKNVYAGVTCPNEKSQGLHTAMGFTLLGVYHHTGYKCGAWHDVAWYEKQIGACERAPQPFRSIRQVDPASIAAILKSHAL